MAEIQSLDLGWLRERKSKRDAVNDASQRAHAAFQRHLTPVQRNYWKRWRWCWVTAPSGTRYRIRGRWFWNIVEYEGEKAKSLWCLSIGVDCPAEDRYLTQLLYLRYNEAEFRRVANEDGG